MRNRIPFDIYTILIIAIVPVFLVTAWGLTWNHERVEKKEACTNANTWLTEVTDLAPLYADAGELRDTENWLSQVQTVNSPGAASELRDIVVSSMSSAINTDPDLETTGTGEVYETLTLFQLSIDDAETTLIERCPDTTPLLSGAFPMYFREGDH